LASQTPKQRKRDVLPHLRARRSLFLAATWPPLPSNRQAPLAGGFKVLPDTAGRLRTWVADQRPFDAQQRALSSPSALRVVSSLETHGAYLAAQPLLAATWPPLPLIARYLLPVRLGQLSRTQTSREIIRIRYNAEVHVQRVSEVPLSAVNLLILRATQLSGHCGALRLPYKVQQIFGILHILHN